MTALETPRLTSDGVQLVPFSERHIHERLVHWLSDSEVLKFSENRHSKGYSRAAAEAYLSARRQAGHPYWAIIETVTDQHIGNVSANIDYNNEIANLGILIGDRGFHGRGLGLAAWNAALDWLLFAGLRKVEAGAMAENVAMTKIFQRSGMELEGCRKSHFLIDGRPCDLILVGKLRSSNKTQR